MLIRRGAQGGDEPGQAPEVIGDIRNFTNVRPVIQINERYMPEL